MATNIGKRRRGTDDGDDKHDLVAHVPKRLKGPQNTGGMNTRNRPSRTFLPPQRPGSIQSAMALDGALGSLAESQPDIDAGPFVYTPLAPGEFRLLRLHPGRDDDRIHCSLVNENIETPSGYEALSYTWGCPAPTKDILLSHEDDTGAIGRPGTFSIGVNLHAALKSLRIYNRPVILWADGLCINQNDSSEKNVQVSRMADIYKNSRRCIVWLGDGDSSIDWAFSQSGSVIRSNSFRQRSDGASLLSAWHDILRRPWFTRRWVVQEITLAREAIFYAGNRHITFEDLQVVVDLITREGTAQLFGDPDLFFANHVAATFDLASTAVRRSGDGRVLARTYTLTELVSRLVSFQASDSRDYIFALLGLAKPNDALQPPVPDYTLSESEVFQATTSYMIEESNSLDIILRRWAPPAGEAKLPVVGEARLPSWIARSNSRNQRRITTPESSLVGLYQTYNASVGLKPEFEITICQHNQRRRISSQPRIASNPTNALSSLVQGIPTLRVSGFELGTITDLSTRVADGLVSRDSLEMCGMSFVDGCEALQITSKDSAWEKLWRTLVADRDAEGKVTPPRFRSAFYRSFKEILRLRGLDTEEMLETERDPDMLSFLQRVRDVTTHRRVFRSTINMCDENLLGLAPRRALQGDKVAILFGLSVPVVLRSEMAAGSGYFTVVGEAYVHGKMEGEAVYELGDSLDEKTQTFQLV